MPFCSGLNVLTLWSRVTNICVNTLAIIGSDNGLSPRLRQTIIWTNPGILLFGPLGTNFGEILIKIHTFPLTKMVLKMSATFQPFCSSLNVLIIQWPWDPPSISSHLTATSAMGIWKTWAICNRSTSKALKIENEILGFRPLLYLVKLN